jgi:hypothetical protein
MYDNSLAFPNGGTLIEDTIPKGAFITALIQCGGIWFAGGKFGITFKLKQACVQPSDFLPRGVNSCGGEPERASRVEPGAVAPPARSVTESQGAAEVSLAVADSDEERDPEADYATPSDDSAPVKGKRKVIKKSA